MKRDFDLIRNILLYIENKCECWTRCCCSEQQKKIQKQYKGNITNSPQNIVSHHINMLKSSGYIITNYLDMRTADISHSNTQLTWKGYEFLSLVRDLEVWQYTKDTLNSTEFGMSIATIENVAKKYITLTLDY